MEVILYTDIYQPNKAKDSLSNQVYEISLENYGGPVVTGPFAGEWLLPVQFTESDSRVIVKAEIPEIDADKIDLRINGDVLIIRMKRAKEETSDIGDHLFGEKNYDSLRFDLKIPSGVASDFIDAMLIDCNLIIQIPKVTKSIEKKIEVKSI